ncbi:MAG: hypothetical protein AB1671_10230 [Thermodesulfobacteriota bacterium]
MSGGYTVRRWNALPPAPLRATGDVTAEFLARGIFTYRSAGRYLAHLSYGRNTDRSNFHLVLPEGRGTCSTKHALLAALAREQDLPVALMLGMYEMNEHNTPGVGAVLERYGLTSIPEAHCYLKYDAMRIDVTRAGVEPTEPIHRFLREEAITPAQIGSFKERWHRQFLREWLATTAAALQVSVETLWDIREQCIAALAQGSRTQPV